MAVENDEVVGTIAFMDYGDYNAVLKRFFVRRDYRGTELRLYRELLKRLKRAGVRHILLDTPSVAHRAHHFYEAAGFRRISVDEAPFAYEFPDRDCFLYLLELNRKEKKLHS